jgi:hypothetical protein
VAIDDNTDLTATEREQHRIQEIEAHCAALYASHPEVKEIEADAIAQGTSPDDVQAQLLRLVRGSRARPVSTVAGGAPDSDQLVQCGLLLSCGYSPARASRDFGERVVDAAMSARHRGASFHSLLRYWTQKSGRPTRTGRFTDEDIRCAFRADAEISIRADSPSTYSLPNLLSNIQNKLLLESFQAVGTVWQKFTFKDQGKDFKTLTRIRLTGQGTFKPIAPGGDIQHMGAQEESFPNAITTQGAIVGIDRVSLVNDDLSGLSTVPRMLGRQGALAVEKAVFSLLLSNAGGFFSSGHSNNNTGSGSALSATSLSTARQLFRQQKDVNNDPVLVEPAVLLVPPSLETTADSLIHSALVVGSTTPNLPIGNINPLEALAEVATSPYLSVSGAPAGVTGSDTQWFLTAGPGDFSCVSVAFLNGQEQPIIESGMMDLQNLGILTRAFFDFGVNFLDFRGAQRSTGT